MENKYELAIKFAAHEVDRYLVANRIAISPSERTNAIKRHAKIIVRSGLKPPYFFDTSGTVRTLQERKQRYEVWQSELIKGINDILIGAKKPPMLFSDKRRDQIKKTILEGNCKNLADTKMTPSDLDKIATFLCDFEKSNHLSDVINFLNTYSSSISYVEKLIKIKSKRSEKEKKLYEHIGDLIKVG
jgi:hypothetical protein